MSLAEMLIASWYKQRKPYKSLYPLAWLYRKYAIQRRKNYLKDKSKIYHAPVPVIVVGNITVGGTGKTPFILWLIEHCQKLGLKPGVVSRGYGAKPPHYPWKVLANQSPEYTGDEPLLIAKRSQVPLVIDPKRANAVQYLLETKTVDIVLCDDGLQHYALGRDIEIVMIDAVRGLGNGYCLPMGPLREPIERLQQVDAVIYNGITADTEQGYAMQLMPSALVNVKTGVEQPLNFFHPQQKLHAVAGIGNPQRFFTTLTTLGWQIIPHSYSDHAHYTKKDFDFNDKLPLIMTEKDAVKCQPFAETHWWYLKVESQLSNQFIQWLDKKIADLTR